MKWLFLSLAIVSTALGQDQSAYVLPGGNNAPIERWAFPDSVTRSGVSGLFAQDIGKIAFQTDTGAYYRLNDLTPTWLVIGGGGGGGSGTVTSITATTPIVVTPSPITNTGVISLDPTSKSNWDTAYTLRLQWDGGSTSLVPATGRASLGLVIGTNVQAWSADLDALSAFTGTSTGLARRTGAGAWSLDTATYLTANQTVTLSGDVTGSGATAITTTYNNAVPTAKAGVLAGGSTNQVLAKNSGSDYDLKWISPASPGTGTVTDFSAGDLSPLFTTTETTTTTTPALAFNLSNAAQNTVFGNTSGLGAGPPSFTTAPRFLSIANLTTNGFIKTGGGTGSLSVDTNTYLTANQTITLSGYTTGSGTTTITTTTNKVNGTATNDSATAGDVGEFTSGGTTSGGAFTATTATPLNVTSITCTAGDWDVEGNVTFAATSASVSQRLACVNTTSATITATTPDQIFISTAPTGSVTENTTVTVPRVRISVASTTTVYMVAQATFSAGTVKVYGKINARRMR